MSYYWPIALIVASNLFYHICSKQTPAEIHPLASPTVTYLVGAVVSAVLYFAMERGGSLLREYRQLNWTAFVLGIAVVGLEAGSIYMYKAGWNVNTGQIFYSSILAGALLVVGRLLYHEAITPTKVLGMAVCLAGLVLINKS